MSWWILKRTKWGERVRRHWDMETHLRAHMVWSHIGSEICRLQSRFTDPVQFHWFNSLTSLQHVWKQTLGIDLTVLGCNYAWSWVEVLLCDCSFPHREQGDVSASLQKQLNEGIRKDGAELLKLNSVKLKSGDSLNGSSDIFLTHADTYWEHQCGENQLFSFWFWKALTVL